MEPGSTLSVMQSERGGDAVRCGEMSCTSEQRDDPGEDLLCSTLIDEELSAGEDECDIHDAGTVDDVGGSEEAPLQLRACEEFIKLWDDEVHCTESLSSG